jgi:hypothetical protein
MLVITMNESLTVVDFMCRHGSPTVDAFMCRNESPTVDDFMCRNESPTVDAFMCRNESPTVDAWVHASDHVSLHVDLQHGHHRHDGTIDKHRTRPLHRKKRFTSFPSPAGMSQTKLPLGRNNSVMTSLFPPRESL